MCHELMSHDEDIYLPDEHLNHSQLMSIQGVHILC
jgi:hypothetical protein